jgi:hypothetical protein
MHPATHREPLWKHPILLKELPGQFDFFGDDNLGLDLSQDALDLDFEFLLVNFLLENEIGQGGLLIGKKICQYSLLIGFERKLKF